MTMYSTVPREGHLLRKTLGDISSKVPLFYPHLILASLPLPSLQSLFLPLFPSFLIFLVLPFPLFLCVSFILIIFIPLFGEGYRPSADIKR